MFMANHRDSSLGFSIFLALGIHNVVEGFTIAFPLYLAWKSRTRAILVAVGLGGLSQPLGALIAYAVTRTSLGSAKDSPQLDLGYGILFGAT
jgi:ZIP family zinc transporter